MSAAMSGVGGPSRIIAVGSSLPEMTRTSLEVEQIVARMSPDCRIRSGLVETLTGVKERRIAPDDQNCSDLAAAAGRAALKNAGVDASEVDALIFASASQDLVEPSTANIVQEKVGSQAPVFDIKNACNSFLNGLQVADALIAAGSHKRVLVTSGELSSRVVRYDCKSDEQLRMNFPGYTLGDAGGAALVGPAEGTRGIFHRAFTTVSRHWPLVVIPAGGTMHPRGEEYTYIQGDGGALRDAFEELGPQLIFDALEQTKTRFEDFARILVHQVSVPFLRDFLRATGIPKEKVEMTLPQFGNMASASLPVAYAQAMARGALRAGDLVLWIGMASGISMGVVMSEV